MAIEEQEVEEQVNEEFDLFDALANGAIPDSGTNNDSDKTSETEEEEAPEAKAEEQSKDVSAIVEKAEKGEGLTEEEIKSLKDAGYEFEEEAPVEEAKPEVKEEEKPKTFEYDDLISELYPGEEFESVEDKAEALRDFVKEEMKLGKQLAQAFEIAPGLSQVIKDITNGVDPAVSLLKHLDFNPEKAPEKDDPDYEKWVEAKVERRIQQEAIEKEKQAIKTNFQNSGKEAQAFAEKHKLNDEQKQKFFNEVNNVIKNITKGKIESPIYDLVIKGLAYDTDVAKAKQIAQAQDGKKIIKIRREQMKGDGLPVIRGKAIPKAAPKMDPMVQDISAAVKSKNTDWGI